MPKLYNGIKTAEPSTALRDLRQKSIGPLQGDNVSAAQRQAAINGSRSLAIKICKYWVDNAKPEFRDDWFRKLQEVSDHG